MAEDHALCPDAEAPQHLAEGAQPGQAQLGTRQIGLERAQTGPVQRGHGQRETKRHPALAPAPAPAPPVQTAHTRLWSPSPVPAPASATASTQAYIGLSTAS